MNGVGRTFAIATALTAAVATGAAAPAPDNGVLSIDLSRPFATRTPWRFTATQGPDQDDPIATGEKVPGAILPCISNDGAQSCRPDLVAALRGREGEDLFSTPHFLEPPRIVHPRGARGKALLLVRMSSVYSGDSDQRVATQLLAYDRVHDRFVGVFAQATGHNNNQEVRYVASGPLKGMIVVADSDARAPHGYWITVNRLTPDYRYRPVLGFRSATHYGDGNPLAVIDSDMPNIQQHLGLWRPGGPLPLPAGRCPKPRLVRMELWCS